MIMVTKRVEFCAAHRLAVPELSDEKNIELFGKCANGSGHGHNYTLEVTIGGQIDPVTGMVYDLKKLKELINREIVNELDHTDLNQKNGFLKGCIPTTENLTLKIWEVLSVKLNPIKLVEIKIWETSNNSVTYRGD